MIERCSNELMSLTWELRNHVLARHSASAGCKGPADFDCEHGDLLYLYQDAAGQPPKAIYGCLFGSARARGSAIKAL
jgi:hypothetical protein